MLEYFLLQLVLNNKVPYHLTLEWMEVHLKLTVIF